jgi:Tol biopolymer transport system component
MAVTPVEGGLPTAIFPVGPAHSERVVHWAPDGHSLAFIDGVGGASNIWIQPLDKGPPRQLTHFTSGTMATFDWSTDGSRLAWLQVQEVRDVVAVALPARGAMTPARAR